MRLILLLLGILFSSQVFGVCMTELDGELYGCKKMPKNQGQWFCTHKYGSDYKAYFTTDSCSKELAFSLRGQEYKPTKNNQGPKIRAACMTYETGKKRGCDLYDYKKAELYCADNYGNRYVPFIITSKCSEEYAAQTRGEISPSKLTEGIDSMLTEVEHMMTMIDKEGVNSSLGGFISKTPRIGGEFYTSVIRKIMAAMNSVKNKLYANSNLNVEINTPKTADFIRYGFRYINLHARLHKIYAYVAHRNNGALNSYNFNNLSYLNLRLKKDFGLEILSQVNYLAKTANDGKDIIFEIGEQEKQTFEYQAIQDPKSKVDYAKLITFLGIRENVTNFWAVQRLSHNPLRNGAVNSCGKGFLSFRPGNKNLMQNSSAIKELEDYDVFYNDYMKRWTYLTELSQMEQILDSEQKSAGLIYEVIHDIPEVNRFLKRHSEDPMKTSTDFRRFSQHDAQLLRDAEQNAWNIFVTQHFSTIVMPGDDIQNKNSIIYRISTDAYNKRVQAIVDTMAGAYVWLSDDAIKKIESKIKTVLNDKNYKDDFFRRMRDKLSAGLFGYNNKSSHVIANLNTKVEDTLTEAYLGVKAMNTGDKLKNKKVLEGEEILEPIDIEELMAFFHAKIDKEYYDVRKTLENNKEMAEILRSFFDAIAVHYDYDYPQYAYQLQNLSKADAVKKIMVDWNFKLRTSLRDAAIKAARDIYANYPFQLSNQYAIGAANYVERDQSSNMANRNALSNEDFADLFNEGVEARMWVNMGTNYADYVTVPSSMRPTYARVSEGPNHRRGKNPDGMTSGRIARPMALTDSGRILTPSGVESVDNNELMWLGAESGILSSVVVNQLRDRKRNIIKYSDNTHVKLIDDPRTFLFRVFHALNLEFVAINDPDVDYFGSFTPNKSDQEILASRRVNQVYQMAPLLRNEVDSKDEKVPLLVKIAKDAYNPITGLINEGRAKQYIRQAINNGIREIPGKLTTFCKADYIHYPSSPEFKKSFIASKYLRATLQTPVGITNIRAQRYKRFDHAITKDIRGRWEAWNEDYFEPIVMITGAAAMIAMGIVLIIGSGGAAAPGVIGGLYVVASTFLAVEFFVSAPFVAGSLYARVNTNFIEIPHQLQFQRSLATTQLNTAKVIDWDMLRADEKENHSQKIWTAALAPLDFLYGAALIKHVRGKLGIAAIASFRRLTGVRLRGWSAPPASMLRNETYTQLRRRLGRWKAVYTGAKQIVTRIAAYTPRYQPLSEALLKSGPLRSGLSRMAAKIGIHNRPWVLATEISEHLEKLKKGLENYRAFVAAEGKLVERVRLNSRFTFRDIKQHGMKYSALSFIPKSLFVAMKEAAKGNPKVLISYFKHFGVVWDELKHIQGELVTGRVKKIESLLAKMEDYHRTVRASGQTGKNTNHMDGFLRLLSDDEIMVLQEMTGRRTGGQLRKFKKVFADYHEILENMRPMHYLYADAGIRFGHIVYPQNIIMGEKAAGYNAFAGNPSEDLVRYYEDMVRQNATLSEESALLRREVEDDVGRLFTTDAKGNRTYIDADAS